MKIITHNKAIKRNQRIGSITTIASLAILAGGMILSMNASVDKLPYSLLALLVGFILSQIGIYYTNRFGRKPRLDEQISDALKGLDDRYTLYHYMTSVSHLLVGPAGAWVILPYTQNGTITYDKRRWKQRGGSTFMKFFAQESLGKPEMEAAASIQQIQKSLAALLPEGSEPKPNALLCFLHPKVSIQAAEAPTSAVTAEKLKDFIRRKAKETPMPDGQITQVRSVLPTEST